MYSYNIKNRPKLLTFLRNKQKKCKNTIKMFGICLHRGSRLPLSWRTFRSSAVSVISHFGYQYLHYCAAVTNEKYFSKDFKAKVLLLFF